MTSPVLFGQLNDGEKFKVLLKGETYLDTIYSRFPISNVTALVENCTFVSTSLGNQKYKITITPLDNNVVSAKTSVQYITSNQPRWITWNLKYLESKITTKDDFVFYDDTETVTISPLNNDFTTASGLKLVGLGKVEGGNAIIADEDVQFTPDTDSDNGYIIYAVRDSLGATANGIIYYIKNPVSIATTDTIRVTMLNTRNHLVFVPNTSFVLSNLPTNANIYNLENKVFQFQPNKGASGRDTITWSNGLSTITYIFDVINVVQNTSSVRDDRFYTPKNTSITFDVFANDLSSNFPIINYSNGLVRDTLGTFTYTPPVGYSGVKNFTYTVNYGQYQSVGKIAIFVGNYNPKNDHDYRFNTLKNQSLVINYDVPVDGYTFNVLNQSLFGYVEVIDNTLVGEGCDNFYSKLTIIYTPDNNYYGLDSFDLEYCVVNSPCVVYKTAIQIHNTASDTLCHCKGPDCVWAGDMNGDGRVSVSDILSLGRYIGLSGHSRNNIDYPFRAGQNSADWVYEQANGINIKHIDANGDGLISEADTTAISEYYADIHTFVPEEILAIKDYPFYLIPNATEVDSGDLLVIDIAIGDSQKPVIDVFGLAFGLNIAPQMIDSASLVVSFDRNSWFATNSPTIQMAKQPKDGVVHAAFTRTNAVVDDELEGFRIVGGSGSGVIGQIIFVVDDELEGFKSQESFVIRRISTNGIEMEDVLGEKFLLPDTYLDIRVNIDKKTPVPTEDKLLVYPNPVTDKLLIHFNGRNEIKGYKVFDQMGSFITGNNEVNAQSTVINTASYPSGIYMVQLVTTQGTITKKVMVMERK